MKILFRLLYPVLGLVSRAGMNEALLLAPEPRINIFFMKSVQNVEHVIHIYHWFTHILYPKAACLCLRRLGCVSTDLPQLSEAIRHHPELLVLASEPHQFRHCQLHLSGTNACCFGSWFWDAASQIKYNIKLRCYNEDACCQTPNNVNMFQWAISPSDTSAWGFTLTELTEKKNLRNTEVKH